MLRTNVSIPNACPGLFYEDLFGKWFANGAFPVEVDRNTPNDTKLKLGPVGVANIKKLTNICLPLILLISGSVILIRRKRK